MKRTLLRASTKPLRRHGPVKARNAQRHAKEWARAYHSPARVRWVAAQPCVVCGMTPSENAHIQTGGMGRKANYQYIVPMCSTAHRNFHQHGREFGDSRSLDLPALARLTEQRWLEHQRRQEG